MKRSSRLAAFGFIAAALLIAIMTAPAAWATPGPLVFAQTLPTRTPTLAPVSPTPEPPATTEPNQTPVPEASVVPPAGGTGGSGSTGTSGAACAAATTLTLVSDRTSVFPGSAVVFTATLTNTSRQALKQLTFDNQLSAGLEPARVISGKGSWQGRLLRTTAATVDPGGRLVVVYSATVSATAGVMETARATATIAGCAPKSAVLTLALPPSELPRTGGSLN